jgi:hypothetical protein
MRGKKNEGGERVSVVLLVLGIAILALSLAADPAGIGGNPSFGRNQITGVIVGAIMIIVGLSTRLKK